MDPFPTGDAPAPHPARRCPKPFNNWPALIVFPQAQLRPPPARLGRRTEGQRALWRQGISGDLPIVVVMIGHLRDIEVVREILTAHTFWNLRGLKVDLVLVSEERPSYDEPLTAHLRQTHRSAGAPDRRRSARRRLSPFGD